MLLSFAACANKGGEPQNTSEAVNTEAANTEAAEPAETEAAEPAETEVAETETAPTEAAPTEQTPVVPAEFKPLEAAPYRRMALDVDTTYVINEKNELLAWGRNDKCQLAGMCKGDSAVPVKIMDNAKEVLVHDLVYVLTTDGELYAWGCIGETLYAREPYLLLDEVREFAYGWAIKTNGDLYVWTRYYGIETIRPVKTAENVVQAAGEYYVTGDGKLYKYGPGDSIEDEAPAINYESELYLENAVKVWSNDPYDMYAFALDAEGRLYKLGLLSGDTYGEGAEEIADGVAYCCVSDDRAFAFKTDGSLWSWMGGGKAEKVLDDAVYVCAGYRVDEDWGVEYNFVIKSDGTLWAWGMNNGGALGVAYDPDTNEVTEPVCVAENVKMVYSNGVTTFIIKTDGTLWGTGYNCDDAYYGASMLGDGTKESKYEFVKIMDGVDHVVLNMNEVYVSDGDNDDEDDEDDRGFGVYGRTFAVKTDGSLWGWGVNLYGAIGDGTAEDRYEPVLVTDGMRLCSGSGMTDK